LIKNGWWLYNTLNPLKGGPRYKNEEIIYPKEKRKPYV
jgi:hypothetical protein